MLRAGDVFAGYLIQRRLGSGGMGEVYLAKHPRLPRSVAVKLLNRDFVADDEIRGRFEREADLIARLDHPNIVSVLDRGVEDDRLWISMQYVDGADASTLTPATLPPEQAVHIVAEVAKALDYAHSVGVLHRDVKPANIMLAQHAPGYGERVLLADFGIARLLGATNNLTRTGSLTVTLAYASPEQLSGVTLDARSDQYSLACTLFWLLCGSTPFESAEPTAVITGHLHFPPPPVSARRAGLPATIDAVLIRALGKRPDDRFGSCTEFATAAGQALAFSAGTPDSAAAQANPAGEPPESAVTVGYPSGIPPTLSDPAAAHRNPVDQGRWRDPAAQPVVPQQGWMPPQPSGNSGPGYAIPGGPPPPASSPPSGPPHSSGSRAKWWLAAGAAAVVVVIAVTVGILRWGAKDSGSQDNAAAAGSAVSTVQPVPLISGIEPIGRLDAQGNLESSFGAGPYPAETTSATCTPQTIAIAGPLSGPNAPLGRNVLGGLRLAVDQFTKRNPDCSITVREFDTLGQPQTSAQVIPQIVNDPSVIALIGPVFSGETKANGKVLSDAGLPFLTPSATNATLSQQGWRTFFRGLASDDIQGPALGRYLAGSVGVTRACVISDDTEYGVGIAAAMTTELGTAALPSCSGTIPLGKDASDMVGKIAAAAPDAVYYGGYYSESAPILKQLRKAGVFAQFYSGDGSFDPEFVSGAGSDGSGTTLTCACGPAASGFDTDYRSLIGSAPGVYSVEAYDLATIVLGGIASGKTSRADLLAYLKGFDGVGLAGYYRWADNGEPAEPRVWLYQVS